MTNPSPMHYTVCYVCHKPVELETSKTDDNGKDAHEECYVQTLTRELPTPSKSSYPLP
jgi:hypothetical protein